ncbi:hypothetical protein N7468_007459 [Penicillium chermesinum]|uniref:Uncharacterized protein n=1 Tax=Penicillium chermesinum TaxID=63820 RepID=A0A9W9TKU3_9EURO|nr:uncharacterized protein N7468_007459 [Penicillium chermesinum]KAJ5226234.1 hypothetical protein N7468_007459 [Penicillium chermesinum]KAJ6160581.1 hypothetical protein N7470_003977 [Penicillium chermesinum]
MQVKGQWFASTIHLTPVLVFISTALPDDFDTAPLESEFFQKKTEAGSFDHLTKEEHYAIIYDSINPQLPKGKGKGKNLKAPPEPIQEPGLDEM